MMKGMCGIKIILQQLKIITTLFLFVSLNVSGQHQERTVFYYNVSFGGFTSGIGATLNKPKNINWKAAFLKGFWQGSIGGLLDYYSKKTLYLINRNQNYYYAWPAKILHSVSNSIRENAALNEPFLQNWNVDFGIVQFDFSLQHKQRFKARFLPETIYAIMACANQGKFDITTSLKTGQIIFSSTRQLYSQNQSVLGINFGRASIYDNTPARFNRYGVLSHELVHQFQYTDYIIFNSWLKPLENRIKSSFLKSIFSKYIYLDIPYIYLFYRISGIHSYPHKYYNFYEFEAERFATNRFVQR